MSWWDQWVGQQHEIMTEERWAICSRCPQLHKWFGHWRCDQCGCFMELKTALPIAHCPLGYW